MSSMTAVENAIDNIPLSMIAEKQTIMEQNIPVIEELEIDMGDYEYRHRNNFMKPHKIKMLDVLIEMKRQIFPELEGRLRYSGKIYQQTRNIRFHPLFPYFRKEGKGKWNAPPTWFREQLEKSIREHPDLNDDDDLIEKCEKVIKKWYDNVGKNTDCGRHTWEWDEEREHRLPKWDIQELFRELEHYQKWKGEWLYISPYGGKHSEEEKHTASIEEELRKKPDGEGYYEQRDMKGYGDVKPPVEMRKEYQKWCLMTDYHITKTTITTALTDAFTYRKNVEFLNQEKYEPYRKVLTLKIKRLYCGNRMDYSANFIGKFHMLRWKKTMSNGNCSNKDLKATHLYYRDEKWKGNSVYDTERGGWIFEAVKVADALRCAENNGFPKWGKKGNGKKAPTYKDIKMWWYKMKD